MCNRYSAAFSLKPHYHDKVAASMGKSTCDKITTCGKEINILIIGLVYREIIKIKKHR